jgi:hypothetical protein
MGGVVSVAGGELVLALETTAKTASAVVLSTAAYDLTGCRASVKLTRVPDAPTKALALFGVNDDASTDTASIVVTDGVLQAKKSANGGASNIVPGGFIDYLSSEHVYLGISELNGELRWETSPDGQTWHTVVSKPNHLSPMVHLRLGTYTYQVEVVPPGETRFDDVNILP